jgi:hypothetical protein
MINIEGLDKADVLAELYNYARPLGMGFLQYNPAPMKKEEAEEIIQNMAGKQLYFDYLKGRVMKVDLSGDEFNGRLYNRDNGENKAEAIIECLREDLAMKERMR